MREFWFLIKVVVLRVLMALVLLMLIYNPWKSLTQWFAPQGLQLDQLEQNWPFKLMVALAVFGILIMFVNTTRKSMGWLGLFFVSAVLFLVGFTPFYLQWLPYNKFDIAYVAYFMALPWLLGLGLSTGYITRYLNGTLMTNSINPHSDGSQHINVTGHH